MAESSTRTVCALDERSVGHRSIELLPADKDDPTALLSCTDACLSSNCGDLSHATRTRVRGQHGPEVVRAPAVGQDLGGSHSLLVIPLQAGSGSAYLRGWQRRYPYRLERTPDMVGVRLGTHPEARPARLELSRAA